MTNLDSIFKSRDITLPTKVHLVKAMVFPVVMDGCEGCNRKKSWGPKNWCFWTAVLGKTHESHLDCKEINQSILKEISPEYSLEGLTLNWNSNTLATWWEELTHWKRPWCWERLKAGGEGDDRGWDGWMAPPTQWTLGVGDGQGSLVCCSPWGLKELDISEWLNWTDTSFRNMACDNRTLNFDRDNLLSDEDS